MPPRKPRQPLRSQKLIQPKQEPLLKKIRAIKLDPKSANFTQAFNEKFNLCMRFVEEGFRSEPGTRDVGRLVQKLYDSVISGKISKFHLLFNVCLLNQISLISVKMGRRRIGEQAEEALAIIHGRRKRLEVSHKKLFDRAFGFDVPRIPSSWAKAKGLVKREVRAWLGTIVQTPEQLHDRVLKIQELRCKPLNENERRYLEMFIDEIMRIATKEFHEVVIELEDLEI